MSGLGDKWKALQEAARMKPKSEAEVAAALKRREESQKLQRSHKESMGVRG